MNFEQTGVIQQSRLRSLLESSPLWVLRRLPAKFLVLNTKFLVLNTKFLVFDTKFLVFDTQLLVFNTEFMTFTHISERSLVSRLPSEGWYMLSACASLSSCVVAQKTLRNTSR